MNEIKDGGPAFPIPLHEGQSYQGHAPCDGITVRDYFAAEALVGMLAYPGCESRGSHHNNNTPDGVAAMAYEYADAMLRARGEA
ncbi:hypothetical protein [Burkholderia vietnamiensis]|uniref:Uncharacterized protein n=1 Tax=Burkholderia vietnamiensis TaxID=60552 RepID=A0AAW7T0X6_BURVI|nr:hypothetical protein [Burkholderia vietnamiensis]MDN7795872.1 hypothetical protein [Burkholderia vietnamiensis]